MSTNYLGPSAWGTAPVCQTCGCAPCGCIDRRSTDGGISLPEPKAPATEYFSDEPVYSAEEVRELITADRRARQGEPVACLSSADFMRIVRANWGDMAAIEAAFNANLATKTAAPDDATHQDALDDALCASIDALLALDAAGTLVPHGLGGHARNLLEKASKRIASIERRAPVEDAREQLPSIYDDEDFRILLRAYENTPFQSLAPLVKHIDKWAARRAAPEKAQAGRGEAAAQTGAEQAETRMDTGFRPLFEGEPKAQAGEQDACPSCNNVGWPDGKGGLMVCPTCNKAPAGEQDARAVPETDCFVCAGTGKRERHAAGGHYPCGQCNGTGRMPLILARPAASKEGGEG